MGPWHRISCLPSGLGETDTDTTIDADGAPLGRHSGLNQALEDTEECMVTRIENGHSRKELES